MFAAIHTQYVTSPEKIIFKTGKKNRAARASVNKRKESFQKSWEEGRRREKRKRISNKARRTPLDGKSAK